MFDEEEVLSFRFKYIPGDSVKKIKGYPFPGEVRSSFLTKAGDVRYVVEATGADYVGMLHIFSEEQLDAR